MLTLNRKVKIRDTKTQIKNIGVIGEGKMGAGIFYFLLENGFDLVWLCSDRADTAKISRQVERKIQRIRGNDRIDIPSAHLYQKMYITVEKEALADCDLIIEAIPENTEMKRTLFLELDAIVKPNAIFTSNSSSIKPSMIAPPAPRAARFAGLHFFYPVALKNIVEIINGSETSAETVGLLGEFLDQVHRRYLLLDEFNSFILNKIFLEVQNRAWQMVQSGQCTIVQMDDLIRKHLFPFGTFDFFDSVGIDTMLASITNYTADYPQKDQYASLITRLAGLVNTGKLGIKSGEGFYTWPQEVTEVREPENSPELIYQLRQTFISAAKNFMASANIPREDANNAIREYFDVEKGPIE